MCIYLSIYYFKQYVGLFIVLDNTFGLWNIISGNELCVLEYMPCALCLVWVGVSGCPYVVVVGVRTCTYWWSFIFYMYRLGIVRDEWNRRSNERRDPDRDRDRGSPPFHSVEPLPPGAYRPRSWLRR